MSDRHRPAIGVLASGSGSTFEAVFESINKNGLPDADIAYVICNNGPSNPEAGIWERCQRLGVKIYHVSNLTQNSCTFPLFNGEPAKGTISYEASDRMLELATEHDVKMLAALGFMKKVIGSVLRSIPIVNEHPAPLPITAGERLVGAQEKVMREGLEFSGPTMHWMDRELDEFGLPLYDNGLIIGHEPVRVTDEMRREWIETGSVDLLKTEVMRVERNMVPIWLQAALDQL